MNLKKLLVVIVSLAFVGGAIAIWGTNFYGISTLAVTSTAETPVIYTSTLDSNAMDTTNSGGSVSDYVDILNTDGNISFVITKNITKTDLEDGCTNYINDCEVVVNDDSFVLSNGETQRIWVTYNCIRLSCPQNINVEIEITGTPI